MSPREAGGSSKMGRSKKECEQYRLLHKREENKLHRAEKRLKNLGHKYPDRQYYIKKLEKGFCVNYKKKGKNI